MKNITDREGQAISTEPATGLPAILSLFCGAGGLDLGFAQEGFSIKLALDVSAAAIATHKQNFPTAVSVCSDLAKLGPSGVRSLMLARVPSGSRIGVIGGPPCQGFSRANNRSVGKDPRNKLPFLYVKIIQELQQSFSVEFAVFENVLGIRDRKHASTYKSLRLAIRNLGFVLEEHELCALDFGVPQNRKRIVLTAIASGSAGKPVVPAHRQGPRTVREVLGDLPSPVFFTRKADSRLFNVHPNHWTMQPKSLRFKSPVEEWGQTRSFKLLDWNKPSPTIAFGHREIHVHPSGTRRLSIYEAMLLQGFPKTFVLEGNLSEQVEQVSNAVPPPLARSVAHAIYGALDFNQLSQLKAVA